MGRTTRPRQERHLRHRPTRSAAILGTLTVEGKPTLHHSGVKGQPGKPDRAGWRLRARTLTPGTFVTAAPVGVSLPEADEEGPAWTRPTNAALTRATAVPLHP